ncbi:class I histocompatibility antigen, F10 alpha chain-like [Hippocampus comes]|uniref:class I histocompatibility antigen, F10 alpha chain-like n=1 Tax=Hippocampus comes TaxID=109280 RepID=UPI00094F23EC|nr:PREDICTED: class I histocompatibility antigen, F10 alpha chain-like [Hippocampus comes]
MKSFAVDNPDYWEMETQRNVVNEHVFLVNIGIAKERFNHTGGVHIIQWMFGCEWNDETNETDGCNQHSYDGEDFIALDTKTMTYVAANPQAFITTLKWNRDQDRKEYRKHYYTEMCPSLLRRLVNYGQKVLMRTELPKVSLLQKTPSSPVTCHASGFYPHMADLFWRKDGEQLHEDVDSGQTLPNHDGTFQMMVDLRLEVTDEVEGQYECVFQLAGVKGEIVTKLEKRNILSNARNEAETRKKIGTIAALLVVVALVVVIVVIVVVIMRRLNRSHDIETSSSSDGELSSESERQMLSKTNGPTQDGEDALTDCVPLAPAGLNDKVPLS